MTVLDESVPLGIALRAPEKRDPFPEEEALVRRFEEDTPAQARMAAKLERATALALECWLRGKRT